MHIVQSVRSLLGQNLVDASILQMHAFIVKQDQYSLSTFVCRSFV